RLARPRLRPLGETGPSRVADLGGRLGRRGPGGLDIGHDAVLDVVGVPGELLAGDIGALGGMLGPRGPLRFALPCSLLCHGPSLRRRGRTLGRPRDPPAGLRPHGAVAERRKRGPPPRRGRRARRVASRGYHRPTATAPLSTE